MNRILKNPIDKLFYELCSKSCNKINLCAPFIKNDIIENILRYKKASTQVCLITNVNLNNFYKRASDIEAIEKILKINRYIYNKTNLHAKVYIFDNEKAIITSGNLTTSGLSRNYEYGLLTNESDIINEVICDYDNLCKDETTGRISTYELNIIRNILFSINNENPYLYSREKIRTKDISNIYQSNIKPIINNLGGWKKDVFIELNKLERSCFTTADFGKFTTILKKQHPENYHIEDKIRQILQQLRDIGLIEFTYRGHYKKLWLSRKV